jgi:hypothetical protein
MERRIGELCGDWNIISKVTRKTDGPENAFLSINKYPNVSVTRMKVSDNTVSEICGMLVSFENLYGYKAMTAVSCHLGAIRSPLLVNFLGKHDVADFSLANINREGILTGCGIDYWDYWGVYIGHDGVCAHPDDQLPLDYLIMNLSATEKVSSGDRILLTRMGLTFTKALDSGIVLENPLSIIWIEGTETEFEQCDIFIGI